MISRNPEDRAERDTRLIRFYKQGIPPARLIERFGLSEAEVFRILKIKAKVKAKYKVKVK